jgi:arginyl-tRNA synthetase
VSLKTGYRPEPKEKELLKLIAEFPAVVKEAGDLFSPALIANYCYELVKEYNQFYHEHSILNAPGQDTREFRLIISSVVADVVKKGMGLLGIEMPERM